MMESIVNPLRLFLLVWGVATTLYLGGVHAGMFPQPDVRTLAAVLLNAVTFCLGYLTWTLFQGLGPLPHGPAASSGRRLTPKVMTRALKFTLAVGVVALLLEMYRLAVVAEHFDTTWVDLATQPELFRIRLVTFIRENIFRASGTVMLLSITNSLFSIGFVLLGVFFYRDRTRSKYLYLVAFLVISLTIGLIHLSRYETTSNILCLVLAYCFTCSTDRSGCEVSGRTSPSGVLQISHLKLHISDYLRLLAPLAAVVVLFAVIDALLDKSSLYDQPSLLRGFLFQVYWYVASPLAAFNEFMATFTGDHLWGQSTFFPLHKWLYRLHLARETQVAVYSEMVFIPYAANVYTYLRNFYEDFGILGVAIIPYLLGWATAAIRVQARRHLHWLNLYLVLLLFILFSFFNHFLISSQSYLQILFGFALFRYQFPGDVSNGVSLSEPPAVGSLTA